MDSGVGSCGRWSPGWEADIERRTRRHSYGFYGRAIRRLDREKYLKAPIIGALCLMRMAVRAGVAARPKRRARLRDSRFQDRNGLLLDMINHIDRNQHFRAVAATGSGVVDLHAPFFCVGGLNQVLIQLGIRLENDTISEC